MKTKIKNTIGIAIIVLLWIFESVVAYFDGGWQEILEVNFKMLLTLALAIPVAILITWLVSD